MDRQEIERLLMKPTARKRLGKYVLLGRLGHGGMGKIYLAYVPGPAGIEKLLVIKRLHSHLSSDPVLVNNFLDEARLAMALSHPNIVHTYDVGAVDGRYFMVMEYIDGQNLGVLLRTSKRSGRYPDSVFWAGLFLGVLDALHAAHCARDARGRPLSIIHRDVSPQNVLVTYDGIPKLVDFGIAKAAMRISETDAGVLKGKYAYMSPEQCQSLELDARSDIFAAGILLWEMLAGRRLYKADNIVRSVDRILHEAPFSPVRVNADCDPELAKVALKALQKRPEDRFSSAEDFRNALDEALHRGGHFFRRSDVRTTMATLFAHVQERQRRMLEACLSGQLDDSTAVGSDFDPAMELSEPPSIQVPDLGLLRAAELTTPSTHARSPLSTQEEERGRAGRNPLAAPSLVDAVPADAPTASGLPAPVLRTTPRPPHARRPSRRNVLVAALTALCVVAAGVWVTVFLGIVVPGDLTESAAALALPTEGAAPASPAAAWEPRTVSDVSSAAPAASMAVAAPEAEAPDDGREPAPDEAAVEERALVPGGEASDEASDVDDWDEPLKEARSSAKSAREDTRRPKKGVSQRRASNANRGRRDLREASSSGDAPSPGSTSSKRPATDTATLTLETVPWTTVYLDGKKLGETPLVRLSVPAGELELLLVNETQGVRETYFLDVKAGGSYRKKLKLD